MRKLTTGDFILAIAGTIIAFTAMAAIFVIYMAISIVLILFSAVIETSLFGNPHLLRVGGKTSQRF